MPPVGFPAGGFLQEDAYDSRYRRRNCSQGGCLQMRSILEELFYGNICPNTDCRSHDKATYSKIIKKVLNDIVFSSFVCYNTY